MARPGPRDGRSGGSLKARSEVQPLRAQARQLASEPSHQDIPALAKRFLEPLRGENPPAPRRPASPRPTLVPTAISFPGQQAHAKVQPNAPEPRPAADQGKRG